MMAEPVAPVGYYPIHISKMVLPAVKSGPPPLNRTDFPADEGSTGVQVARQVDSVPNDVDSNGAALKSGLEL